MLLSSESQTIKLDFVQRLKLRTFGACRVGYIQKDDWASKLPYFAFNCEKHGLVFSRTYGFKQYLMCPICEEERRAEKELTEEELLLMMEETKIIEQNEL